MNRAAAHRYYLVSIWYSDTDEGGNPVWRYRLEDPRSGEQWGFTSLEALFKKLDRLTVELAGPV